MLSKIIIGLLAVALAASAVLNFVLLQKVAQLDEKLKPAKAQQAAQSRQTALRVKFDQKMAQDRQKYSQQQLNEAEQLYSGGQPEMGHARGEQQPASDDSEISRH